MVLEFPTIHQAEADMISVHHGNKMHGRKGLVYILEKHVRNIAFTVPTNACAEYVKWQVLVDRSRACLIAKRSPDGGGNN